MKHIRKKYRIEDSEIRGAGSHTRKHRGGVVARVGDGHHVEDELHISRKNDQHGDVLGDRAEDDLRDTGHHTVLRLHALQAACSEGATCA